MSLKPSTSCFLQGGQILRMDSRVEVKDYLNNIVHRFPIADYGAIADQGEFYTTASLSADQPYYLLDESLTGFTGSTSTADVDLVYVETSAPIFVELGYGIATGTSTRKQSSTLLDVYSVMLHKTNYLATIPVSSSQDQRVLPIKIYLQYGISAANVIIYLAKFSY